MRVDLRVPVGLPLAALGEFARRCEAAGFHGVGIHDHPHSGRDVYVALTVAGLATARLALYPATSSPVTRHPLLLASLAGSLAELCPGRTALTLAPGFLAVRSIGRPRASLATMREAVLTVRRLLRGDAVAFGDVETRLRNRPATPPPVYLLAAGPRMVELAGEVADGALVLAGLDPRAIAAARAHLAAGARRAGRDPAGVPVVFIVPVAVEDRLERAREWPRRWFAPGHPWLTYPSAANLYWLRQAGLELPDPPVPEAIPEPLAARIADAFGLFGPPERCRERLRQAEAEAGVERVFLFPAHTREGGYDMPDLAALSRLL